MAKTVHDLRNEIRVAVGRYEREVSSGFTKEALAAICEAVGYEIDQDRFPSKSQMRAGILWKIGEVEDDDPESVGNSFRKGELEAIATALDDA
jgi:RecJ-like exonuclease